jgi:hypothetical protein
MSRLAQFEFVGPMIRKQKTASECRLGVHGKGASPSGSNPAALVAKAAGVDSRQCLSLPRK